MKTSKKLLILAKALGITILTSFLFALPISLLTSYSIIGVTLLITGLQIVGNYCYQKYIEIAVIKDYIDHVKSKPFQVYEMNLECQHCGKTQIVPIDLTESEYTCDHCKKRNGVYTTIKLVAISEPMENITIK